MALSGSVDFTANREQMVTAALRICNVAGTGQTPSAEDMADGVQALNMMIKAWQADGLQLFARRRVSLLLEKNVSKYTLSTAGSYATYSENLNETAIRVAGLTSDTVIEVDTTIGMTAGDYIAIILDDGTLHKTTIASVTDSDTVVITTGLASAAAIDNRVWWFTTKVARPLRVLQSFLRDSANVDTMISVISQDEYWALSTKTNDGRVNQVYYDPQYAAGYLYVWPQTDSVTSTMELIIQKSFDDLDASTNNVEFPSEWLNAIKFNLALMLSYEIGLPGTFIDRLEKRAFMEKGVLLSYDQENASLFFQPERHG